MGEAAGHWVAPRLQPDGVWTMLEQWRAREQHLAAHPDLMPKRLAKHGVRHHVRLHLRFDVPPSHVWQQQCGLALVQAHPAPTVNGCLVVVAHRVVPAAGRVVCAQVEHTVAAGVGHGLTGLVQWARLAQSMHCRTVSARPHTHNKVTQDAPASSVATTRRPTTGQMHTRTVYSSSMAWASRSSIISAWTGGGGV